MCLRRGMCVGCVSAGDVCGVCLSRGRMWGVCVGG